MITQQDYLSTATAQKTTCFLVLCKDSTCKYKKKELYFLRNFNESSTKYNNEQVY